MPTTTQLLPLVFVVDDDVSVRESLEPLIRVAGWEPETFTSAQEFLARPRVLAPSCLVLDIGLPGLNGLELQELVAAERSDMPIIFITGPNDVPMTVRALKAGAVEFLTKPFSDEVLLAAIGQALEWSRAALSRELNTRVLRERYEPLSPREREVMALVVSRRLNKQGGGELGISEITVKAHRGKVMRKMKAGSLADLVNMAASLQLEANRKDWQEGLRGTGPLTRWQARTADRPRRRRWYLARGSRLWTATVSATVAPGRSGDLGPGKRAPDAR